MLKEKVQWSLWVHILLVALAVMLVIVLSISGTKVVIPEPTPLTFCGSYSQNGGAWLPLEEDTKLNAAKGAVVLRGSFSSDVPEGESLNLYLDHLAYRIFINGEFYMCSNTWDAPRSQLTCYKTWETVVSPGITTEHEIEIQLQNLHSKGNVRAYNEMLESLCVAESSDLREYLRGKSVVWRTAGLMIIGLSLAIMGIALSFWLMKVSCSSNFWTMGLMSLFAGVWIALDTSYVAQWTYLDLFNTYVTDLVVVLLVFELGMLIHSNVSKSVQKVTSIVVAAEAAVVALIFIVCLIVKIRIYDLLTYWVAFQYGSCMVLLVCCICDCIRRRKEKPGLLWICALMMVSVLVDLVNVRFGWWSLGLVSKVLFMVLFMVLVLRGIQRISVNYRTAYQMEKMEADLRNSRIMAAMSQIRTHFVFNILNAISGMCKYDPEQADETVVRFSRYLRTNINIMQEDSPVAFRAALQHLEDYVMLEQVRFGDNVKFETEIAADDFLVPPLILQPLVENAIKHGLRPKPGGGTVTLRTWREEDGVRISIGDDGVGFDTKEKRKDESIGLSNVSFRVQQLVGGSLHVDSEPGKGTTVTIFIPGKEERT